MKEFERFMAQGLEIKSENVGINTAEVTDIGVYFADQIRKLSLSLGSYFFDKHAEKELLGVNLPNGYFYASAFSLMHGFNLCLSAIPADKFKTLTQVNDFDGSLHGFTELDLDLKNQLNLTSLSGKYQTLTSDFLTILNRDGFESLFDRMTKKIDLTQSLIALSLELDIIASFCDIHLSELESMRDFTPEGYSYGSFDDLLKASNNNPYKNVYLIDNFIYQIIEGVEPNGEDFYPVVSSRENVKLLSMGRLSKEFFHSVFYYASFKQMLRISANVALYFGNVFYALSNSKEDKQKIVSTFEDFIIALDSFPEFEYDGGSQDMRLYDYSQKLNELKEKERNLQLKAERQAREKEKQNQRDLRSKKRQEAKLEKARKQAELKAQQEKQKNEQIELERQRSLEIQKQEQERKAQIELEYQARLLEEQKKEALEAELKNVKHLNAILEHKESTLQQMKTLFAQIVSSDGAQNPEVLKYVAKWILDFKNLKGEFSLDLNLNFHDAEIIFEDAAELNDLIDELNLEFNGLVEKFNSICVQ